MRGVVSSIWLTLMAWAAPAAYAQEVELQIPTLPSAPISVHILNHEMADRNPDELLQVFVGPMLACCASKMPIAGVYEINGTLLSFDPVFDLMSGQTYTVQTALTDPPHRVEFTLGADAPATAPKVTAIYPSGPVLPENTLRFYIHFSAPMQPHRAADLITLVDATGTPDPEAFMAFRQELWSPDRTRLTLLLDPGRIKRGVAQNVALGPALTAGERFGIAIKPGWGSANGGQTMPATTHWFDVAAPLRVRPAPELWDIAAPRVGTLDPLVIEFDRPFDHVRTLSSLRLTDADDTPISGSAELTNHETVWTFQPDTIWNVTRLDLLIDARLEDVAGNNFRELMDYAAGTPINDADVIQITIPTLPTP